VDERGKWDKLRREGGNKEGGRSEVNCDRENEGRRKRKVSGESGEKNGGGMKIWVGGCGR
jgi:hypothetical protein